MGDAECNCLARQMDGSLYWECPVHGSSAARDQVASAADAMTRHESDYVNATEVTKSLARIFLDPQTLASLAVEEYGDEFAKDVMMDNDLGETERKAKLTFAIAGMVMYRIQRGDIMKDYKPKLDSYGAVQDPGSVNDVTGPWTYAINYAQNWVNAYSDIVDELLRSWTLEDLPTHMDRIRERRKAMK